MSPTSTACAGGSSSRGWQPCPPHRVTSAQGRSRRSTPAPPRIGRDDYGDFVEHELDFHAALVSHLGSPRLDRFFAQVIGELRLLFSDLTSDSQPGRAAELLEMYRSIYTSAEGGEVAHCPAPLERSSGRVRGAAARGRRRARLNQRARSPGRPDPGRLKRPWGVIVDIPTMSGRLARVARRWPSSAKT